MLTLNEVFDSWQTGGGIFSVLQFLPVPWKTNKISSQLDLEYHGNISGEKIISPLVNKVLTDVTITTQQKENLANIIMSLYRVNWEKNWQTQLETYNPIENYSMTEKMTDDKTVDEYGKTQTRTNDLSHTKTGSETDKPDITTTQTPDLINTTENAVNGFNSSQTVPTGTQNQKSTGTSTGTQTGTNTREYNTTDTDTGTQTDSTGGTDTRTRTYTLTRSGNIGVTTSQQMLQSERDLWMWNFFHDVVFPDVDKVLTIQIY